MKTETPPSLHGSCHCGAIRLTLPFIPEKATRCNCSLCRRTGAVWAYYEFGSVRIEGQSDQAVGYVQGDKTIRTVHCKTCGITTHWEPIPSQPGARHGVNLNNFEPGLLQAVRIRHIDGADTWAFLD